MSGEGVTSKSREHEHVERVWARMKPNSPIYEFLLGQVIIVSASKGVVKARLVLGHNHVNSRGTIHGAVSATFIDWVGGMAIASYDLREKSGVSTDIHITYLSTAEEGDTIEVEGRADKVGGTLGFTTVTIRKLTENGEPGPIVASGSHTKYVKQ